MRADSMKCQSVVVIVSFLLQLVPCAAESGDDLTTLWNRVGELFQAVNTARRFRSRKISANFTTRWAGPRELSPCISAL